MPSWKKVQKQFDQKMLFKNNLTKNNFYKKVRMTIV